MSFLSYRYYLNLYFTCGALKCLNVQTLHVEAGHTHTKSGSCNGTILIVAITQAS